MYASFTHPPLLPMRLAALCQERDKKRAKASKSEMLALTRLCSRNIHAPPPIPSLPHFSPECPLLIHNQQAVGSAPKHLTTTKLGLRLLNSCGTREEIGSLLQEAQLHINLNIHRMQSLGFEEVFF